jgi:type II secretory ATPase GspE/PulE/Tfp pilus assembly ATPase PilB-like protein
MLAGTFNLVMAERLARRVCYNCKSTKTILEDPKFIYARESFRNFNKDLLKKEINKRGITQEQRNNFIQK